MTGNFKKGLHSLNKKLPWPRKGRKRGNRDTEGDEKTFLLHDMPPSRAQSEPEQRSLLGMMAHDSPDPCPGPCNRRRAKKTKLESGLQDWIILLFDTMKKGINDESLLQNRIDSLIDLSKIVNADLECRIKIVDEVCKLNMKYFETAYAIYDEQIQAYYEEEMGIICKQFLSQPGTTSNCHDSIFRLFSLLRQFSSLATKVQRDRPSLSVHKCFHSWFMPIILELVGRMGLHSRSDIEKHVLLDDLRENDSESKVTMSAVDTAAHINKIPLLWKSLDWPEPFFSYNILEKMSEVLRDFAVSYGVSMESKLVKQIKKGSKKEPGPPQSDISYKLCRGLNSLEYIRTHMNDVQDKFQPSSTLKTLQDILGPAQSEHLSNIFERGRQSLRLVQVETVKCMTDKMTPQMDRYIAAVFRKERDGTTKRLLWTETAQSRGQQQASMCYSELLQYLDDNLTVVIDTIPTDSDVRKEIVSCLWSACFHAFKLKTDKYIKDRQSPAFFACIAKRWLDLRDSHFWNEAYKQFDQILDDLASDLTRMESLISLHSKSTAELKWKFLKERADDLKPPQLSGPGPRVCFNAAFNFTPTRKKLTVHLVNCFDLDLSDGSSVYAKVEVTLWRKRKNPDETPFEACKKTETRKISGNSKFEFNQSITFDFPGERFEEVPAGWIYITIKANRFLRKNLILSHVLTPAHSLDFRENVLTAPTLHLRLLSPPPSAACQQILSILANRSSEGQAFAKEQAKKFPSS